MARRKGRAVVSRAIHLTPLGSPPLAPRRAPHRPVRVSRFGRRSGERLHDQSSEFDQTEFNKQGLAEVIAKAFTYIKENEIDAFLAIAAEKLAPLQKVSVFINALDLMLSDGQVNGGETAILKKIQDAFGIDRDMVMAIREVIFAKNDTRMFLHPEHPRNASDAFLRINYRAAANNE